MAKEIDQCLPDIRNVLAEVESEKCKTPEEKAASFVRKIKNPYEYRVGDVTVRVSFSGGSSIDDCFANFLSTM